MTLLRTTRGGKPVEFALANGGVLIGTAPGCQIVVADPAVAPKHCKIAKSAQGFVITDLSSGGTIVNGAKIKEQVLKNGDVIQVGSEKFTFAEKQEEPVAVGAKAPAPVAKAGNGGGSPPAGGRRPLPSRAPASGGRPGAPTARKMTPKPGSVSRVQKSKSVFVLPSTPKGKAIMIAVAVGIVVLGGVLFVISSNTKNSEEIKKLAEKDMKDLAAIPEAEYEKRLEKIDAIVTNEDYIKYALQVIDPARRVQVQVKGMVDLQRAANNIVKPFIERYKGLKNGAIEDFKRQWDSLYDEVTVHLNNYGNTTYAAELAAIRAELKELIEKIGPGWDVESVKLARDVQKQIESNNFNHALNEVEDFEKRFKDVDSAQLKKLLQEHRAMIQRQAKARVEVLKRTAAEKSTKEEKRRILEAARPFLQGCAEALKELEKAINEIGK